MHHDDPLRGTQLRDPALQLHRLVDRCADKILDLALSECRQHAAPKASNKTFRAREAHAVALVTAAVQHLHPSADQHTPQLFFFPAFIVVVSQHHDRWQSQQQHLPVLADQLHLAAKIEVAVGPINHMSDVGAIKALAPRHKNLRRD